MTTLKIESFSGSHRFLSNFWACTILYNGKEYPSAEHAYQASKFNDLHMVELIRTAPTAKEAKDLGKMPGMKAEFNRIKTQVMEDILRIKFAPNSDLAHLLLNTENAELIEGNYWHDTFWGVCDGEGQNELGKILMKIRDDLRRT